MKRNVKLWICIVLCIMSVMVTVSGCKKEENNQGIEVNEGAVINEPDVTTPVPTEISSEQPSSTTSTQQGNTNNSNINNIDAKNAANFTIVIDAGHQRKGNNEHEPIAPGATETKPKVAQGTTGVASNVAEFIVTLQVSQKIESILKNKGYNVIMVRDNHDVNISNSERAKVANDANADAFIRIHCNGASSSSANGALTMCQTRNNPYCGQYYTKSRELSDKVLKRIVEVTGAKNMGVSETDKMSGINWCSVPVTIVEMGFMSNREEDLKLVDDAYQNKMAQGIANGVIEYLNAQ